MNMIARNREGETVLILDWQRGTFLGLHNDGSLKEYRVSELRCDLLEAQMRIATNEQANAELFAEVAANAG